MPPKQNEPTNQNETKTPKNPTTKHQNINQPEKNNQKSKKQNLGLSHIFCSCRWKRAIDHDFNFRSIFNVSKIVTWVSD